MELWAAGVVMIAAAIGIPIFMRGNKVRKGFRIAAIFVLGVLLAAALGYVILTFLLLGAVDSPPSEESVPFTEKRITEEI